MLLGHEDLQTTMLYLSHDFEEIQRDAVAVDVGLRGPLQPSSNA